MILPTLQKLLLGQVSLDMLHDPNNNPAASALDTYQVGLLGKDQQLTTRKKLIFILNQLSWPSYPGSMVQVIALICFKAGIFLLMSSAKTWIVSRLQWNNLEEKLGKKTKNTGEFASYIHIGVIDWIKVLMRFDKSHLPYPQRLPCCRWRKRWALQGGICQVWIFGSYQYWETEATFIGRCIDSRTFYLQQRKLLEWVSFQETV